MEVMMCEYSIKRVTHTYIHIEALIKFYRLLILRLHSQHQRDAYSPHMNECQQHFGKLVCILQEGDENATT